jgi:hypothetical protein
MTLVWRMVYRTIDRVVAEAAKTVLTERTLHMADGTAIRWLPAEVAAFTAGLHDAAAELRRNAASLDKLGFGNRLVAELAVYTMAGMKHLVRSGVETECAKEIVADLGWRVYRRMLALYSLPARLVTRDPAKRLTWTIRMLLRFPFSAHEPHGYAVETRQDGDGIHTHFTRCPPQTVVREIAAKEGDGELLEAFYRSWCQYDWPGADVIAGDRKRGHYRRTMTLSRGDPVCDMCWIGRAPKNRKQDAAR